MDNKKKSGSRTTPDLAKTIGDRINEALALCDVKQKDLAKALGVTDNTVSYYCSGSRTPNTQQITEIAKFLNVSTDWLLGLSDNRTTDQATKELCATLGLSERAIEVLTGDLLCEQRNQQAEKLLLDHIRQTLSFLLEEYALCLDRGKPNYASIAILADFFHLLHLSNAHYLRFNGQYLLVENAEGERNAQMPTDQVFKTKEAQFAFEENIKELMLSSKLQKIIGRFETLKNNAITEVEDEEP